MAGLQPHRDHGSADVGGLCRRDAGAVARAGSLTVAVPKWGLTRSGGAGEGACPAGALHPRTLVPATPHSRSGAGFRSRSRGRNAMVPAGHFAQRQAVSRRVFLEASLRSISQQRSPTWAACLVLCAGFAGGPFSVDAAGWRPLQAAALSRSSRAISAGLVGLGLPVFLRLAQQAAGLFVAFIAAARGVDRAGPG